MRYQIIPWLAAACFGAGSSQAENIDTQPVSPAEVLQTIGIAAEQALGLPEVPVPVDNPVTPDKIRLGEQLYKDTRFSGDGTVSCATCHAPEKAFTDHLPTAQGIRQQTGTRNSPTVINAAFYTHQFWDGRRPSLETQAMDPFTNPIEHGLPDHNKIVEIARTDPDYQKQFKQVFATSPENTSLDHVLKAIATFERSVIAGNSAFDRYQYQGDKTAMSEAAVRGLELYKGKARCVSCHTIEETSATFTDNLFHNLGVGFDKIGNPAKAAREFMQAESGNTDEAVLSQEKISELGRFAITRNFRDLGAFKTSTLRNIALTAPYMHDGSLATLKEVIELYNKGGNKNPALDSGIRPLNLTDQEISDLVEFLKSLTSDRYADLAR